MSEEATRYPQADHAGAAASAPPDAPLFAATLTPHRSLDRAGFRLVMTLCCLATIVASVPFAVMGAWPVAGFFGLDLLALFIAFKVNVRDAAGHERVVLTSGELLVRKQPARGEAREWRFNPLWSRLEREDDEDYGVQRLAIVSGPRRLAFGQFLAPEEKESLHRALSAALAQARRGPFRD